MKIIAISDTHRLHGSLKIPEGDVLIHAGDLTKHGSLEDVIDFNYFLGTLPHPHKNVIAGNLDFCFEKAQKACEEPLTNCIYLQDQEVTLDEVRFYGSPWQPWFYDWSFNLERGPEIRAKLELISEDTFVLITHGPPVGIGNLTAHGEQAGCKDLLEVVEKIKPIVHQKHTIHPFHPNCTGVAPNCTINTYQINWIGDSIRKDPAFENIKWGLYNRYVYSH
jgi:Icc-related predicted phosphoesterase